jgi:uncharacterized membrane protein
MRGALRPAISWSMPGANLSTAFQWEKINMQASEPRREIRYEYDTPENNRSFGKTDESKINVGDGERLVSGIFGGLLALHGLKRGGFAGYLLAALGGSLVYRGATGQCSMYKAMGINTATEGKGVQQGILFEKSVEINKSPDELYNFWRNFENLPRFMDHLESVKCITDTHSHWVAKAPAGMKVEWGAEIINDIPGEKIAWQSLPDADVRNAGTVIFEDAGEGRTHVRVRIQYLPVAGLLGDAIAKLLGENPAQQVEEDLNRFKELVESGDIDAEVEESTRRFSV